MSHEEEHLRFTSDFHKDMWGEGMGRAWEVLGRDQLSCAIRAEEKGALSCHEGIVLYCLKGKSC